MKLLRYRLPPRAARLYASYTSTVGEYRTYPRLYRFVVRRLLIVVVVVVVACSLLRRRRRRGRLPAGCKLRPPSIAARERMMAMSGSGNSSYTTLTGSSSSDANNGGSTKAEPPTCGACFERVKGVAAACFLAVLTAALFVLRSGPLASGMCSNVILMIAETIKFVVAMCFVMSARQTDRLFQSVALACVPTMCALLASPCARTAPSAPWSCTPITGTDRPSFSERAGVHARRMYVTVNLLSFWALKYVHASLGALMSQIKLPATAVFSRIFLGRVVSFDRTMALCTIFLGALAVAAYGQMQKEDSGADNSGFPDTTQVLYTLATVALLAESCLSAATGVFTQWVFQNSWDTLWVRNAQFGVLSFTQYAILQFVIEKNEGTCTVALDRRGVTVGVLYATMGISVALTILWLGAIEKTLASVSSVVLTSFADHLFVLHTTPTLLELCISGVIINGIVHFSATT